MVTYTTITNTIMGKSALGLLIDLHIQDFVPANVAIMYYNYIAISLIVMWAGFASASNESRYTFTTPFFAAFLVWIGWLNAGLDAASYWGIILFCLFLGAIMYINDMNHEKYGTAGPGDKLIALSFMIMCFTASFGFVSSSQLGLFNGQASGTSQNVMCGTAYSCDANGNVDLAVSVTSVKSSGGLWESILDDISILTAIALSILKLVVVVIGSVLFFSVVVLAAYPELATSAQVVAFLAVLNLVIWAIYLSTFFRWFYKPGLGDGHI